MGFHLSRYALNQSSLRISVSQQFPQCHQDLAVLISGNGDDCNGSVLLGGDGSTIPEGDVLALSLPPQSSHGCLDRDDDVVVPLGTHYHLGKVLVTVAGDGKDEPGHALLALLGVSDQMAIFFFLPVHSAPVYLRQPRE